MVRNQDSAGRTKPGLTDARIRVRQRHRLQLLAGVLSRENEGLVDLTGFEPVTS